MASTLHHVHPTTHAEWLEAHSAEMLRHIQQALTRAPVMIAEGWDYDVEGAARSARCAHYRFTKLSQREINRRTR